MLAIERRNQILERLQSEKRVVVSELSQIYQVSEETIRRDLEKLENDGLVIKSYGGAVLNEHSIFDMPFNIRKNQKIMEKQAIAGIAASLIRDGEAMMLDASSTAVYLAKAMKNRKKLTVITNSVEIVVELFDVPEWTVISTGGVSRERSFALVGPRADQMISGYHVDKTFISCKGFSLEHGLTDSDEQDANCKRMMLEAAKERILVADSSKFGKTAFTKVADLNQIDKVITDRKPDRKWLEAFEQKGIDCLYPKV